MDNYNFTKGKWSLGDKRKIYQFIDCKDQGWYEMARVIVKLDGELSIEGKANALLISKAPEMLEKLSEIVNILDIKCTDGCVNKTWGDFQNGNGEDVGLEIDKFIKDTKQLIKEATEL